MKRIICLLFALALSAPAFAAEGRVGIAALVNDDVVTFTDIGNRAKLYSLDTPAAQPEQETRARVLATLIDEKLQLQEAKSLGINITDNQITGGFDSIARANGADADSFRKKLTEAGVPLETLNDQIRAQIAWSMVVRRKLRPQINVSEEEIDSELSQPQASAPATVTVISLKQIMIPIDADEPAAVVSAKMARAASLKKEIVSCADMDLKMQDFASEGTGDMGKGPLESLPPPLKAAVSPLKIGELSAPLRGQNGVAVVMVCGREQATVQDGTTAAAPAVSETAREEIANRIGLRRLDQLQARYLSDLRAAAFIDRRI